MLVAKTSTSHLMIFSSFPVGPPVITQHPVSQIISTGAEATTFKIEATGDDLTFQWQKNGSDLHSDSNYSGTDTNTLKIRHVKKSYTGVYRCLVKNRVEKEGKLSNEAELAVCKLSVLYWVAQLAGHVPGCAFNFNLRKSLSFTLNQLFT